MCTYIFPSLFLSIIFHEDNITGMFAVTCANINNNTHENIQSNTHTKNNISPDFNLYVDNNFSMNCLFQGYIFLLFILFK